jgi:excisionase family DNA binding protein
LLFALALLMIFRCLVDLGFGIAWLWVHFRGRSEGVFGRTRCKWPMQTTYLVDNSNREMPDPPIPSESLMTADEAAQLLHIPRSTLYELVRSRGLPHVRIGERGLRFTRADLGSWIAENSYGTRGRR